MKPNYAVEAEATLALNGGIDAYPPLGGSGVGILIDDPMCRRLVETASRHLELLPVLLTEASLDPAVLADLEVIVADEQPAEKIRSIFSTREGHGDWINPAIIAVRRSNSDETHSPSREDHNFDNLFSLPLAPAAIAEQLSLTLYSHRAFAKRYRSALEELHLNRRIFRSVTSGIAVANAVLPDMPLIYVNPAFEVMTGYRMEEILGKNCRFLQGTEHDQPSLNLIREAYREQREVTVVLKNFRKNGTSFWNELRLSPICNRDGELTHFVGIQTDVTARVEFETALRESEKLAAVGRLASSIAHEINNPLESVMNLLYLAQLPDNAGEAKGYLQLADKELQRIALITSQSLRFYKQSTKPQETTCPELLESVLDLYEGRARNAHIAIERQEGSSGRILCLESEIRQVLNNLVRNAIDAMRGSGGRLLIRSRDATDWRTGRCGLNITIADTGSGMSAQTMANLYKPFHTTKGIAGTGLGLWISNEIVARHGGRLRVRSSERTGRSGTVFQLFLPSGLPPAPVGEFTQDHQDQLSSFGPL